MEDGQVIYKHRGKPDKYTFADKACDIYERLAELPPYGEIFTKMESKQNDDNDKAKSYKMKMPKDNICYDSSDDDDFVEEEEDSDGTSSWAYSIY